MQSQKGSSKHLVFIVIWGVFLWTILVHGYAIFNLTRAENTSIEVALASDMLLPILGIAAAAFLAAINLPKLIFRLSRMSKSKGHPEPQATDELKPYFVPFVVRMVLFEVISICGFILAFLTKSFESFVVLAAIAAIAMITNYPSKEKLKSAFAL